MHYDGAMNMTKRPEPLPRPAAELERLAEYYETHDTGAEMESGDWIEPRPMATTSLRLPVEVIEELKRQARARHLRYTSYVRSILERAARGEMPPEIADITERLERIERAVTARHSSGDQKTALQSDRPPRAVAGWTH
jgi:CopG antitoxin of type II toxin-antitoxin system